MSTCIFASRIRPFRVFVAVTATSSLMDRAGTLVSRKDRTCVQASGASGLRHIAPRQRQEAYPGRASSDSRATGVADAADLGRVFRIEHHEGSEFAIPADEPALQHCFLFDALDADAVRTVARLFGRAAEVVELVSFDRRLGGMNDPDGLPDDDGQNLAGRGQGRTLVDGSHVTLLVMDARIPSRDSQSASK